MMSRVHSLDSKISDGPVKRITGNVTTRITPEMQAQKATIRNILRGPALPAKPVMAAGRQMPEDVHRSGSVQAAAHDRLVRWEKERVHYNVQWQRASGHQG
jgi:hypothetical protein